MKANFKLIANFSWRRISTVVLTLAQLWPNFIIKVSLLLFFGQVGVKIDYILSKFWKFQSQNFGKVLEIMLQSSNLRTLNGKRDKSEFILTCPNPLRLYKETLAVRLRVESLAWLSLDLDSYTWGLWNRRKGQVL